MIYSIRISLGHGEMVSQLTLDQFFGVRIPVSQPIYRPTSAYLPNFQLTINSILEQ